VEALVSEPICDQTVWFLLMVTRADAVVFMLLDRFVVGVLAE
jgi:hypothetical protein